MASGIDDRRRRLWPRLGQTLRGRANHRTWNLLSISTPSALETSSIVLTTHDHSANNELAEVSVSMREKLHEAPDDLPRLSSAVSWRLHIRARASARTGGLHPSTTAKGGILALERAGTGFAIAAGHMGDGSCLRDRRRWEAHHQLRRAPQGALRSGCEWPLQPANLQSQPRRVRQRRQGQRHA